MPDSVRPQSGLTTFDEPGIAREWNGSGTATSRVSIWIICLVVVIPAVAYFDDPSDAMSRDAFGVALVALLYAGAAHVLNVVDIRLRWMPYASIFVYLSIVTWVAVEMITQLSPDRLGWLSIPFMLYFLIVGATSLRNRMSTVWFAGALAGVLLVGITFYALQHAAQVGGMRSVVLLEEFEPVRTAARFSMLAGSMLLAATVARRGAMLQHQSVRDGLTGLLNRRFFDQLLDRQHRRAERRQHPVAIAVLDLDYFKQINDRCGHAGGDAVLRRVGEVLRQAFRGDDFVARYGGEEFVAVLPDTSEDVVVERLEQLRVEIGALPVVDPVTGEPLQISVSIGVASWPDDGEHLGHVFREADRRLYAAKDEGRNCVVSRAMVPAHSQP